MRLLTEMSIDTQFIVITHSKRAMEAARAMYGVTMLEAVCADDEMVNRGNPH